MKYAFFGTPRFAALLLARLVELGIPPVAVVTNPDRPVGRRQLLTAPPAKQEAEKVGIPVLQPEKLLEAKEELAALGVEVFVVAAYGRIIPRAIFSLPPRGTVGVHPSLLPRHRGASPIQTAILEGDAETGISLFLVDEEVDHGPLIASASLPLLGTETYLGLEASLARSGADLVADTLSAYLTGKLQPHDQEHATATFTKKFSSPDAHLAPEELETALHDTDGAIARRVDRMVRALNPEPGVWTVREGKRMKILRTELDGTKLILREIQYEGRKSQLL